MQVHHDEGVANRIDPESCAGAREGIGEALTGERPGVVLDTGMCARSLLGNREISWSASATCVPHWSVSGRRGAVADDVRS